MSANARAARTELVGSYRDRQGRLFQVLIRCPASACHQVVEVAADQEPRLIEELAGEGESRATALALARDYLGQQGAAG
jgi:hypothetical protein